MKKENKLRRGASRKTVQGVSVSNITALSQFAMIARCGSMVDVSSTGILLMIDRRDLVPKTLKDNLSLHSIEGEHIMIRISGMDLDLDGYVSRTRHLGKGVFEVAIDFSSDAPEYWRECLVDLMPAPGDIEE